MSCDEPKSEVLQTDFWSVLCSVSASKYPLVLPGGPATGHAEHVQTIVKP